MSTTTANLNAPEIPAREVADAATGAVKNVLLASVGVFVLAGKGVNRLYQTLVEQGKEVQPSIGTGLDKVRSEVSSTFGEMGAKVKEVGGKIRGASEGEKLEPDFENRVSSLLQRMGVATHQDLQSINARLDEIARSLNIRHGESAGSESEASEGDEQREERGGQRPRRRQQ